jgi:hypothetical protein
VSFCPQAISRTFFAEVYPGENFTITAHEDYGNKIDGKQAMKLGSRFSVKMVEVGNKNNILEFTGCVATFGFVSER